MDFHRPRGTVVPLEYQDNAIGEELIQAKHFALRVRYVQWFFHRTDGDCNILLMQIAFHLYLFQVGSDSHTEDVAMMFQAIIEDREAPKTEKVIDGYTGFLFYDNDGNPLVAMHWQHRFNNMVGRYNDIYRVQMPNITPHVCRHTYCSNMAKSGMNPKTLQYLMGHSDISVTMNVYTHISFDDAEEELKRMEEFRKAQMEVDKGKDGKAVTQKMFKVVQGVKTDVKKVVAFWRRV